MKKLIVLIFIMSLFSFELEKGTIIYCKPEIKYCIHNLKEMKNWLKYDKEQNKISEYVYQEYLLVLDNTQRSLEMMLENKGQCDTISGRPEKFKYDLTQ